MPNRQVSHCRVQLGGAVDQVVNQHVDLTSGKCRERGADPRRSLSQISHGLDGRHGTMAFILDSQEDADLQFWAPAHWLDTFH
jgi:hypothetical protein